MIKATLIKRQDGLFQAATAYDNELLSSIKTGTAATFEIKRKSKRSLQHHRLFFGGLLPLAFDYWQAPSGMITAGEQQAVTGFAQQLEAMHHTGGLFIEFAGEYLADLARKRGEKLGAVLRDIEMFRKWLTVEAGYFDLYDTPNGVRKEPKSISFVNMEQDEFNAFYKNCFDVVWNMFLKHKFENEEQAQQAMLDLLELGQ